MTKANAQAKYLVEAKGPDVVCTAGDLLKTRSLKYLMVNILARRARDLNRGDQRPLVELTPPFSTVELAIAEVQSEKLNLIRKPKNKVLVNLVKNE
jgi:DNA-directed RNA polymerase subunit K/omega